VGKRPGVELASRPGLEHRPPQRISRRLGRRPKEWVAPEVPEGVVSVTAPDTQRMKANHGYVHRGAGPVAVRGALKLLGSILQRAVEAQHIGI
jgi:hypothetical protein